MKLKVGLWVAVLVGVEVPGDQVGLRVKTGVSVGAAGAVGITEKDFEQLVIVPRRARTDKKTTGNQNLLFITHPYSSRRRIAHMTYLLDGPEAF